MEPDSSREVEVSVSTVAPGGFTARELKALYYYDLGPEHIDLSGHPERQRDNYKVFARACSRCHTLARAINSPRDNCLLWEYYVLRMRLYGAMEDGGADFTRAEADRILEFLGYDSRERKAKAARGF